MKGEEGDWHITFFSFLFPLLPSFLPSFCISLFSPYFLFSLQLADAEGSVLPSSSLSSSTSKCFLPSTYSVVHHLTVSFFCFSSWKHDYSRIKEWGCTRNSLFQSIPFSIKNDCTWTINRSTWPKDRKDGGNDLASGRLIFRLALNHSWWSEKKGKDI